MLKAIVVGARINVLGVSQLTDVSQALEDFRVDERRRYGTKLDALVDLIVGFRPILVISELPQDEVVARRLEPLRRLEVFVAELAQPVQLVFSFERRRHRGYLDRYVYR